MAGKFVIENAKSGFHFNLVAGNGEVIASSQVYTAKAGAKNGIESVRANCNAPTEDQTVEGFAHEKLPKYEIFKDKAGEFRFRLKAANSEIIATSEGYTSKQGAQNGIESVKSNAPTAEIVDKTE